MNAEFITLARAQVFYRKLRRRQARAGGLRYTDSKGLPGWNMIGTGHFGEAWQHEDHDHLVIKISGRAGFGDGLVHAGETSLDGWAVFAEHCFNSPHPNLPKLLHFERVSVGISWGIMPLYENADSAESKEVRTQWRNWLDGARGSPQWLWPIIGMRGALEMQVDLHGGNVMYDADNDEYIMTDPFSFRDGMID